ncbi:EamA family transporter [Nocardia asteroides]|uniref:EamA family transporter n=1 Tax=Nocardia asteroides TaxID=1824 RepID=UPI0037BA4C22
MLARWRVLLAYTAVEIIGPIIYDRTLADLPALGVVTASLLLAALVYAPFSAASWPARIPADAAWSVLGLAVICTAIAFLVFFALIAEVGPARATVITYVNPAVAIVLGVAALGEPLTIGMVLGFPLVVIGSIIGTRGAVRVRDQLPAPADR